MTARQGGLRHPEPASGYARATQGAVMVQVLRHYCAEVVQLLIKLR